MTPIVSADAPAVKPDAPTVLIQAMNGSYPPGCPTRCAVVAESPAALYVRVPDGDVVTFSRETGRDRRNAWRLVPGKAETGAAPTP